MIWQELGNLLLDLPLLPLFLLLILSLWRADLVAKAVWRAEDNCQRSLARSQLNFECFGWFSISFEEALR